MGITATEILDHLPEGASDKMKLDIADLLRAVIADMLSTEQQAKLVLVKFGFIEGAGPTRFDVDYRYETNSTIMRLLLPCTFMDKPIELPMAIEADESRVMQAQAHGLERFTYDKQHVFGSFVKAMSVMGVKL